MNNESIKDYIKKISLEEGDLLIFRVPKDKPMYSNKVIEGINKYVRKFGAVVVFAEYGIDVEKFNEKQMEKMGWIRKDKHASSKTK